MNKNRRGVLAPRHPLQSSELKKEKSAGGFTLLEMLIVVVMIVLIFLLALPSITSFFKVSLNSATRDLASVIKEGYNAAVITGKVYRVAYDLKENTFWVEVGPVDALLQTKESKEKEEARKKFRRPDDKKEKSEFQMDKLITRKKHPLPRGVVFEDIMTQLGDEPITSGIAYSHFFPHGMSEQTIIHLQDQSNHHSSLVLTSLVGQSELYDRYVGKEEAFGTGR